MEMERVYKLDSERTGVVASGSASPPCFEVHALAHFRAYLQGML